MSEIVVQEFITLDGVVQGGGGPDEDRDGGFALGGWATGFDAQEGDGAEIGDLVAEWESRTEALLLGRRTYDIWAGAWGVWSEDADGLDGELTRRYNRVTKHVATRSATGFAWRNTEPLGSDVPAAVRRLREEPSDGEVRVWGSTRLVATLAEHDLVDEYRLMVYPLVLGTGKRLFPEGSARMRLALVASRPLRSGIVVNTFRRRPAG